MKISTTFYNEEGELMAPLPLDVKLSTVTPGGIPSVEEGFYHRFKFEGRTKDELDRKTRRFFAEMGEIPRYSTLTLRPYEVEMGSYIRFGLDVLYVVESQEQAAAAARSARTRGAAAQAQPASTAVIARRS